MNKYCLKIKDSNGVNIGEITDWKPFNITWELNREGSLSFNRSIDATVFTESTLYPLKHFIDVYRYNKKIWSGILTQVNPRLDENYGDMGLTFNGFLWLLRKMKVSPSGRIFSAVDQGDILWSLIDQFQSLPNGNWTITQGVTETGTTRDRTYEPLKDMYDAAIEMTEIINGCDVEITDDMVFNAYAHKGIKLKHVFEYGKNIKKIDFSIDGKDVINQSFAVGKSSTADIFYNVAHDMQSQEVYKLLQGVFSFPSVELEDTLAEHAKECASAYSQPIKVYGCELYPTDDPTFGAYSVGDEIRLIAKKEYVNIDVYKRIQKITLSVDQEEKESIKVDFI